MSLEHALTGEIRKLKGQLGGMVREVDQYRQTMENAQAGLARAEEALVSQRALISYLEMSLEEATDPVWKKGDRFCFHGFPPPVYGTIVDMYNDTVYVSYDKEPTREAIKLDKFAKLAVRT